MYIYEYRYRLFHIKFQYRQPQHFFGSAMTAIIKIFEINLKCLTFFPKGHRIGFIIMALKTYFMFRKLTTKNRNIHSIVLTNIYLNSHLNVNFYFKFNICMHMYVCLRKAKSNWNFIFENKNGTKKGTFTVFH